MQESARMSPNPRRPPTHLSVSLKRGAPKASGQPGSAPNTRTRNKYQSSKVSPLRQTSYGSNSSSTGNVEKWFDRTSKQPPNVDLPMVEDDQMLSPCFVPATVSMQSNEPEASHLLHPPYTRLNEGACHANSAHSSADDYRSVIDDLTIENKRLREKLRKFERLHSTHLEKDKLFEVKIHALPAAKRRDLEDTLRNFASRIDESREEAPRLQTKLVGAELPTPGSDTKDGTFGSSNSRPDDSGYASMPNSGATSTATRNTAAVDKKPRPTTQITKEQNIRSFLHDIPEGLLPKHSVAMTERQKKTLVVKRLEQLFTGKVKGTIASHNQTLQQQEVSRSAARADRAGNTQPTEEGLREAIILPHQMDVDAGGPAGLPDQSSQDTTSSSPSLSGICGLNATSSPDQRPTRPLDLDPDREQIPLENIKYLHHLGISTTQLVTEDSSDAEPDAQGWIFLNLLINMAQLHIMNVTPDFVRSAVSDVSAKFQLSEDGQKIRWRGGREGTRLSSDSDNSSVSGKHCHEQDSDSRIDPKRQRVEGHAKRSGHVTSIPQRSHGLTSSRNVFTVDKSFHYKPLFAHANTSDDCTSFKTSSLDRGSSTSEVSGKTGVSRDGHPGRQQAGSSASRRRTDDGPIVFYSGARFCTDLSSDRTKLLTPLHITGIGPGGYSNHTEDALGCAPSRPTSKFVRTDSGSLMRSRPFKDYSIGDPLRKPSPEVIMGEQSVDEDQNLDMNLEWSSHSAPMAPLLDLSASGLGGTQPADHFVYSIRTRRTKLLSVSSKTSRSFGMDTVSAAALDLRNRCERDRMADGITAGLASMSAFSSQPQQSCYPGLPIQSEIIDTKFLQLEPSQLPEPSAYYEVMSTTDSDSTSDTSSSSGLDQYRQPITFNPWPGATVSNPDFHSLHGDESGKTSHEHEREDSDSSIDMLAQLRAADPDAVAAEEAEFEMLVDRPGSSVASVAGPSVSSSNYESESEGEDSDDGSE